jgi:hypothetical protein
MDTSKIKKVGTREEVFKNIALRTAGGLKKDDIIEKRIGNRILYISKKLSDKMKENINILRTHNPNFLKRIQKKTIVNTNEIRPNTAQSIVTQSTAAQPSTTQPLISILKKKQNTGTHAKTQKLSFKVNDNSVKTVFYPELKGINLKELKEEILREEAEEDLGIKLPKKKLEDFSIDEMPDIDISNLD